MMPRHACALLCACLALYACSGQQETEDGDMLAGIRMALQKPAVAGFLLDPQLSGAEAVDYPQELALSVMQRRPSADPDRLTLRVRVIGKANVVVPPPLPADVANRLLEDVDADPAARSRMLEQARAAAAKRIPPQQRTVPFQIDRVILVTVQRQPAGWQPVLPKHLMDRP